MAYSLALESLADSLSCHHNICTAGGNTHILTTGLDDGLGSRRVSKVGPIQRKPHRTARINFLTLFSHLAKFGNMNKVFKALADPTRRQVLALLKDGPLTAGELADHFEVSKPTMSAHFAILREADLIGSSKLGKSVVYCLKLSVLEEALAGFAGFLGLEVKALNQPVEPDSWPEGKR